MRDLTSTFDAKEPAGAFFQRENGPKAAPKKTTRQGEKCLLPLGNAFLLQ
jgi:hypothetical protein